MRKFVFGFNQRFCAEHKISLKQVLILKYVKDFILSGESHSCVKDGKIFYWISAQKILDDLPILDIDKRQLKRLLADLEQKKMLDKTSIKQHTYLNITKFLVAQNEKNALVAKNTEYLKDVDLQKVGYNNGLFYVEDGDDSQLRMPIKFLHVKRIYKDTFIKKINIYLNSSGKYVILRDICSKYLSLPSTSTTVLTFVSVHAKIIALNYANVFKQAVYYALGFFKQVELHDVSEVEKIADELNSKSCLPTDTKINVKKDEQEQNEDEK